VKKDGNWDVYRVKISIIMGLIGFVLNLVPISVAINDIYFSIIPGIFTAFFITQIWGLRYGLLTAICGSTQTMWWLWLSDGYGLFYSVPVYTLWIVWHGILSDKRRSDSKPIFLHSKYIQEIVIRVPIEIGFWTIFPFLVSFNPPPWINASNSVSQLFLISVSIKHTAVAYVMMLLTDVLTGFGFIRKWFKLEDHRGKRHFIVPFVILWSVFFWILDGTLTSLFFLDLKKFYSTTPLLSTIELMFIQYPITNFFVRIVFAVFMLAAAFIIYDFYQKEKRKDIIFKQIFENSVDMIFLISSTGKIQRVNKASKEKLKECLQKKSIDECFIPESNQGISQQMMAHGGEARFIAKAVDDENMMFDCVTSCIDQEKNDYLLIARDITHTLKMNHQLKMLNDQLLSSYEELESSYEEIEEKSDTLEEKNQVIEQSNKELEEAFQTIQQAKERYESLYCSNEYIMQSIPEMIVRFNKKGDILWMNKAFKAQFDLSEIDRNMGDIRVNGVLLIDEKNFLRVWSGEPNKPFTISVSNDMILNVISVPAVEENEIIMIMFDITKIRMREEYFKNAKKAADEAAAMKDEFIAKISHELRTPMNGIVTAVHLMKDLNQSLDCEMKEYLSIIDTSSKRLMTTINELLDISKLERGQDEIKLEQTDIYNLLESLKSEFSVLARRKRLAFSVEMEGDVPRYCFADREKLNHILSNLIFNAIKFTSEGFVKCVVRGEKLSEQNYHLTFLVMDSGIGIAKEEQDLVFEKFTQVDNSYTREYEGTGLGLAISQGIAKVLNSKIKLQSERGKGATFYFTIVVSPVIASENTISKKEIDSVEAYTKKLKKIQPLIFVAEDDPINAKLLAKVLKKVGCHLNIYENALLLLDELKTNIPDIILMDIQMPGMNGMDATKHIKGNPNTKHIPVIALSAHAFEREQERSFKSGIDDYLTKPIDQKLLFKTLLKNLE